MKADDGVRRYFIFVPNQGRWAIPATSLTEARHTARMSGATWLFIENPPTFRERIVPESKETSGV